MNMRPNIATTPRLSPNDDYMSENGAYRLARKIREFWSLRGLHPKVWVAKSLTQASQSAEERPSFIVKSDMMGGRPI